MALTDLGPYVIAVDLGVDRMSVARIGLGGIVQQRAQAPIDGVAEAWQVGASVATLIRSVTEDAPRRRRSSASASASRSGPPQ